METGVEGAPKTPRRKPAHALNRPAVPPGPIHAECPGHGPGKAAAKELATNQLAKLAARNAAKQTAAAKAKPKRKPAPTTEKPAPLRDQVRAGLLRRRA